MGSVDSQLLSSVYLSRLALSSASPTHCFMPIHDVRENEAALSPVI